MASSTATLLHFPSNSHLPPLPPSPSSLKPFLKPDLISNRSFLPKLPNFSLSPSQSLSPKAHLLALISDQNRGLETQQNPKVRSQIIDAIESLAVLGKNLITTDNSLSGTWRMIWTTEKEQLFIIKNANVFGTKVGDVLQVIDVDSLKLNNVITFPPSGVFFVRSNIEIASSQRVNFRFTSAVLRGKDWEFPLPPFGKGW